MPVKGRSERGNRWLLLYTLLYLCGMAVVLLVLIGYHRTLVWIGDARDGLRQHYTVLGYVGQVVRDLLAGRGYRMVNFSLGQGMDTLTTLSFYGYTDPLSLLAAFFRVEDTEVVYIVIDLLRMYFAGVCFGFYARKVGARQHWAVACGAMVYVFSGYFLRQMGRHPYFLNGALYLPLLLLGVERVLENRRWLLYTLVTALMLVVNFYFAYMNTVAAILYIVVRLIARLPERGVARSAGDGFILLGGYLLGAALAAVVFVPVAKLFFESSRMGVDAGYQGSFLHYERSYYSQSLLQIFAPWGTAGHYSRLNYLPTALFGLVALLFARNARARQVRIGLLMCLVTLCVPALGKLMNGWAYVSNRWCYILAMFVALGCTLGLAELERKGSTRVCVVAAIGLVVAVALAVQSIRTHHPKELVVPIVMAATALLLACGAKRPKRMDRRWLRAVLIGCTVVSCAVNVAAGYTELGKSYIRQQGKWGLFDRISSATPAALIRDDGVYRVGQAGYDDSNALLLGYRGTSFYWSLVDMEMSEYYQRLGLPDQYFSYNVETLGASAEMNEVAAVKYYARLEDQDYTIPWGYEKCQTLTLLDGKAADIYENKLALPLGYTYDKVLPKAAYDALPMEDKLQAIMACAIVDSDPGRGGADFESHAGTVDFAMTPVRDAELEEGCIRAGVGGTIRLGFDIPEDCQAYLMIEGLHFRESKSVDPCYFTARSANGTSRGVVTTRNSNFYFPKHEFALCLGSGPLDGCELEFEGQGAFTYDALRVVALPLSNYRADVEARMAEGMRDVTLGNDRITGRIDVPSDRILQIAVPYSKGWSAWVDGVKQPVFRCGGMYMGLDLKPGAHEIEMRYVTPGLVPGMCISAAALLLTVVLAVVCAVRRRRKEEDA